MSEFRNFQKRKVLFVTKTYTFAGAERRLISWLNYVDYNAIDIVVLSQNDCFPDDVKHKFRHICFDICDFNQVKSPKQWNYIFKKYKPKAIVFMEVWFTNFNLLPIVVAWMFTKGNVYMTEHSDLPLISTNNCFFLKKLFRVFFRKYPLTLRAYFSKKILTVSHYMKRAMIKHYNYPANKIIVSYYPIDSSKFSPINDVNFKIREQKGIPLDHTVIISISRLTRDKGVEIIIKSFKQLITRTKRTDVWLWIVGEGDCFIDLHKMSEKLGISNRIIFWGYQNEIVSFLRESNIFILASLIEASGVALLEAMSVGLVAIATETGGAREVLKDRRFLVKANEESILNAMIDVLNLDQQQTSCIKHNNRNYVLHHFDAETEIRTALDTLDINVVGKLSKNI